MAKVTPAIEQYLRTKAEHPDCILFFRMGDFYEMFFDDAKTASKALEIALTSRGKHRGEDVPLCGVPYHAADGYISRLLAKGYKVAICEQIEDPKQAKGIVQAGGHARDHSRHRARSRRAWAAPRIPCSPRLPRTTTADLEWHTLDFSTGEFKCTELDGIDALFDELGRIEPKELILPEPLLSEPEFKRAWEEYVNALGEEPLLNKQEESEFDFQDNYKRLCDHFRVESLYGFGLDSARQAIIASGVLLGYLEQTQLLGARALGGSWRERTCAAGSAAQPHH